MKKNILFIFLIVLGLSVSYFTNFKNYHVVEIKNGEIDLTEAQLTNNQILKLEGEWSFYPNILIDPSQSLSQYEENRVKVHIPHTNWNELVKPNDKGIAVGTYYAEIEVPKDGEYGLYIQRIRQINQVFINGESIGFKGNPTPGVSTFQADNDEKYIVTGQSEGKKLKVYIQVANHIFEEVGIKNPVEFGRQEAIEENYRIKVISEIFPIIGFIVMGVIYISSYLQNRRRKEELFFGLFVFSLGIHMSFLGQKLFFEVFQQFDYLAQKHFQALGSSFLYNLFTFFMYYMFPKKFNKKFLNAMLGIWIIYYVSFLMVFLYNGEFIDSRTFKMFDIITFIISLFQFSYISFILFKVMLARGEERKYIVQLFTLFVLYNIATIMTYTTNFQTEYVKLVFFIFIMFSFSGFLSYRANASYNRAIQLSEELTAHNEMKDEFLLRTSHELRTPLNGILNISKSLMEGAEGPLKREQQENMLLIHNISQRIAQLLDELLYSSSYITGELRISKRAVSTNVMKEVVEEVRYIIPKEKSIVIRCEIEEELPFMYTDELRIKQVLYNLLTNAVKYSTDGEILVKGTKLGEFIQLQVIDHGVGISAQDLKHIFDSFYRAKRTQGEEGLGLGLSISKNIIETLNGTIAVQSEVGIGSIFTVTMPIATEEQKENLLGKEEIKEDFTLPMPFKRFGVGKTILIVDDSHVNLKVLIDMLSKHDYNIVAVDNGEAALDYVKNEKIDMMLVDLMMYGMSGYELCKEVRKLYDVLELPIIVLTAISQHTDLLMSLQVGANDYMQKPVDMDELNMRMESLLAMGQSAIEAVEKEMNYLYTQVTPHFLYNTLNTIIALSYIDVEKMREALNCLATYFRAKLDVHYRNSSVSIENEIELVQAYLYIEQLRYGDRLKVEYEIDEKINLQLPALTIQPIVENAIFHGISKRKDGGTVKLTVKREMNTINIIIADNGVGIPPEIQQTLLTKGGTRIGFSNPLKKIKLIKNATLQLHSEEGKGTTVTITIPDESSDYRI